MAEGVCRICGAIGQGVEFDEWVKPTFTNHDRLRPGDIICEPCLFWFGEQSELLAEKVGKDKPQKMRNYSHIVKNGVWIPLSKADKPHMLALLTESPFPELAVIADSGQKHLAAWARRNLAGGYAGWVQFEEQCLWLEPAVFVGLVGDIEGLYATFSKAEIETGNYGQHRIVKFGVAAWWELEGRIREQRGSAYFTLALFLAQREEQDDGATQSTGGDVGDHMERSSLRVQKSLSDNDLDAVRGPGAKRGVHQQSEQCHQPTLFEIGG